MDRRWASYDAITSQNPPDDYNPQGRPLTATVSLGAEGAWNSIWGWRGACSYTKGNNRFSLLQGFAGVRWACLRRRGTELYLLTGPTLNAFQGNYEIKQGALPPFGEGEYRKVSQSNRPGLKLGIGFQFYGVWNLELTIDGVSADRSGPQGINRSWTGCGGISMQYRFGAPPAS